MATSGDELFDGIVSSSRNPWSRFGGAALALVAWGSLWVWAVTAVAAPLGGAVRAGGAAAAGVVAPVAPGGDSASTPPIAPAACAC